MSLEDLEVTSVTTIEVTSIVFLFHSNQRRTWCIVVLKDELVHSLLRIDETITDGSACVFYPLLSSSKQTIMMMDEFSWNLVRPWTDELIKDVKDNQWIYLPRPDWPFNG